VTDQTQPECPEEYRWMKPGEIGIQILSQKFAIIQSEPAYICREWRVRVDYPDSAFGERTRSLSINCELLEDAKSDRDEITSDLERLRNFRLFDVAKIEAQDKELESLRTRLEEAEAKVSELTAENERLKQGRESLANRIKELGTEYNRYIQEHEYLVGKERREVKKWRDAFELATEARDKILREQANGLPPDTLTAQQSLRIVALEMQLHDAVGRAIMDVMKLSAIRTILANLAPMVDEGERTMKFGYSEIADYSIKNLPIVLSGLREIQKIGGGEGE